MPGRWNDNTSVCAWVSDDVLIALEEIAKELGVKRSELIREILVSFVETYYSHKREIKEIKKKAVTREGIKRRVLEFIIPRIRF